MEQPELIAQRYHQLDKLNGQERFYERVDVQSDGTHMGNTSDGCSWEGADDLFSPAITWNNCGSSDEWKNGENANLTKKGEIWPLVVGNQVSFSYDQINALGKNTGKKTRKCEVLSQVKIDVAAGNLDTYKVRCVRRKGDWSQTQIWYFSPEMNSDVKYVRSSSSEGIEVDHELVRIEAL